MKLMSGLKRNALRYPILSRIARDYLAIQGTSVASERTFSSAGLTDSNRRRRLTPDNFASIQIAKGSLKHKRTRDKKAKEQALKELTKKWVAKEKEAEATRLQKGKVNTILA